MLPALKVSFGSPNSPLYGGTNRPSPPGASSVLRLRCAGRTSAQPSCGVDMYLTFRNVGQCPRPLCSTKYLSVYHTVHVQRNTLEVTGV